MPQLNDLSRSLVALDQDSTIIAVVELSQSSWLVAGVLAGIERQPRKKLEPSAERLLGLLHRRGGKMRLPSHETRFDLADSLHPARYRDNAHQPNQLGAARHLRLAPSPALRPEVEDVVEIDVGKQERSNGAVSTGFSRPLIEFGSNSAAAVLDLFSGCATCSARCTAAIRPRGAITKS